MKVRFDVTSGMRGNFAVLVDEETGEAIQTGLGSYATPQGAAIEAADWAESEDYPLQAAEIRKKYNL